MPQDRLEQKLRQLGLSHHHGNPKRLTFRLYFPRPPYGPVEYLAAKQGDGLNFVGQLLGHGGCTLKKIQTDSGARVEVHDGKGNLNGTHPSYTDPSLHAVVFAETREKLTKAAKMIAEVLRPVDTTFEKFDVNPGGSALLKPVLPTKKTKSPRSETSARAWGGASTPSSENDSTAEGSIVQGNSKSVVQGNSARTWKKVAENKNEKENSGWREWKTWGTGSSDCYSQFTALTQNLVSQYAARPKVVRPVERPSHVDAFGPPVWNAAKLNGSNIHSSFSTQLTPPGMDFAQGNVISPPSGQQKLESVDTLESFPLPYVYEDLIGSTAPTPIRSQIEGSRLTGAYQIKLDSERPKNIHQRILLPHDL